MSERDPSRDVPNVVIGPVGDEPVDAEAMAAELEPNERSEESAGTAARDRRRRVWCWGVLTAGFALYLLLGQVNARYERHNILGAAVPARSRRSILDIWRLQAENLPNVSQPSVLEAAFVVCLIAFVLLTILALWLACVSIGSAIPPATGGSGGQTER